MNFKSTLALNAAAALSPCVSSSAIAQTGKLSSEAPAIVMLQKNLDSPPSSLPAAKVEAKLTEAVHLSNGTEIPKNSWLVATVAQDDSNATGKTKLALRFNEARLENGKTMPIEACPCMEMLKRTSPPSPMIPAASKLSWRPPTTSIPSPIKSMRPASPGVSGSTLATAPGCSGVLVSAKDDIKLPDGTKMELAVAPGM